MKQKGPPVRIVFYGYLRSQLYVKYNNTVCSSCDIASSNIITFLLYL